MNHHFETAPWSPLLKGLSALSLLILIGVSFGASRVVPAQAAAHVTGLLVAVLPLLIAAGSLLFVVTSYELDASELHVQRLFWQTRIPLDQLQSASAMPDLLKGTKRVVGNGGMLSFSGQFYRRDLGRYQVFITDWKMAVVLRTANKTIAISPADKAGFMHTLHLLYPQARLE